MSSSGCSASLSPRCQSTCGCFARSALSRSVTQADSGCTGSIRTSLKPIHDWVANLEQLWSERFAALDEVLEELKAEEEHDGAGNR